MQARASVSKERGAHGREEVAFDVELDMRIARAHQTMDYAASQRARFATLSIASLTIWQALELLEAVPMCVPPSPTTIHPQDASVLFWACASGPRCSLACLAIGWH